MDGPSAPIIFLASYVPGPGTPFFSLELTLKLEPNLTLGFDYLTALRFSNEYVPGPGTALVLMPVSLNLLSLPNFVDGIGFKLEIAVRTSYYPGPGRSFLLVTSKNFNCVLPIEDCIATS